MKKLYNKEKGYEFITNQSIIQHSSKLRLQWFYEFWQHLNTQIFAKSGFNIFYAALLFSVSERQLKGKRIYYFLKTGYFMNWEGTEIGINQHFLNIK